MLFLTLKTYKSSVEHMCKPLGKQMQIH